MPKELGETTDPKELVPSNPGAVTTTLTAMRGYGDALHNAGTGLQRIDTTDGWSGKAGDGETPSGARHSQPRPQPIEQRWQRGSERGRRGP